MSRKPLLVGLFLGIAALAGLFLFLNSETNIQPIGYVLTDGLRIAQPAERSLATYLDEEAKVYLVVAVAVPYHYLVVGEADYQAFREVAGNRGESIARSRVTHMNPSIFSLTFGDRKIVKGELLAYWEYPDKRVSGRHHYRRQFTPSHYNVDAGSDWWQAFRFSFARRALPRLKLAVASVIDKSDVKPPITIALEGRPPVQVPDSRLDNVLNIIYWIRISCAAEGCVPTRRKLEKQRDFSSLQIWFPALAQQEQSLRVGPFLDEESARQAMERAKRHGLDTLDVEVEYPDGYRRDPP